MGVSPAAIEASRLGGWDRPENSGVFDPAAHFETASEGALREGQLAVGEERFAPDLCRVGFAAGVAAVRMGCTPFVPGE